MYIILVHTCMGHAERASREECDCCHDWLCEKKKLAIKFYAQTYASDLLTLSGIVLCFELS